MVRVENRPTAFPLGRDQPSKIPAFCRQHLGPLSATTSSDVMNRTFQWTGWSRLANPLNRNTMRGTSAPLDKGRGVTTFIS